MRSGPERAVHPPCSSILFIVIFSLLLRLERWRPSLGLAASLIAFGLVLFTWRAEQLDVRGLALVELAALCTGVRWTVSQLIMQGEEQPSPLRHPLDMVAHVQGWMFLTILPVVYFVEGEQITWQGIASFDQTFQPVKILFLVLVGGLLAFLMEMSGGSPRPDTHPNLFRVPPAGQHFGNHAQHSGHYKGRSGCPAGFLSRR